MITIYKYDGQARLSVEINENSIRKFELMKEDYVQLVFSSNVSYELEIGDYIDFALEDYPLISSFGRFVLTKDYVPTYNTNTAGYDYTVKFDNQYWIAANKVIKYKPQTGGVESSWSLTAYPTVFLEIAAANFKALDIKYRSGDSVPVDYNFVVLGKYNEKQISMTFSNVSILNFFSELAQKLECDWWFDGNYFYLGKCETEDIETFKAGTVDANVESVSVSEGQKDKANKIYMFGSETNIPYYYRKKLEFTITNVINSGNGCLFVDSYRPLFADYFKNKTYVPAQTSTQTTNFRSSSFHTEEKRDAFQLMSCKPSDIDTAELSSYWNGGYISVKSASGFQVAIELFHTENLTFTAVANFSVVDEEGNAIASWDEMNLTVGNDHIARLTSLPKIEFYSSVVNLFLKCEVLVKQSEETYNVVFGTWTCNLEVQNLNPSASTTIHIGENTYDVVLNNSHMDELQLNPMGHILCKDHVFNVGDVFAIDNIIKGKCGAQYFTNDVSEDLVVNGVVVKRLMLPVDFDKLSEVADGKYIGMDDEDEHVEDYQRYWQFDGESYPNLGSVMDDYGIPEVQIIEQVAIDDDIKPSYEDTVTWVSEPIHDTEKLDDGTIIDRYYYRIKGEKFKDFTSDFIIKGTTLQIVFSSGKLNGMTFELSMFQEDGETVFEIINNENYVVTIPNDTIFPQLGDKFNIINYDPAFIGESLIYEAEGRLLESGFKLIKEYLKDKNTKTLTMFSDYMKTYQTTHPSLYKAGCVARLVGDPFFGANDTRVIGFEYKLDYPYDSPKVIVGETSAYSKFDELSKQIESAIYNGGTYSSVGGSGGSVISLIKRGDTIRSNDTMPYSSARTDEEIAKNNAVVSGALNNKLSRVSDDTAEGNITFRQNINVGGNITGDGDLNIGGNGNIELDLEVGQDFHVEGNAEIDQNLTVDGESEFTEMTHHRGGLQAGVYTGNGILGTGAQIDAQGNAVVESLTARSFFSAPVYRFNRIEVTEGERWSTNALGTIESVEIIDDLTGIVTLHMEEGEEYSSVKAGDICRGIYNAMAAGVVSSVTVAQDGTLDDCGFRQRYGFFTSYFMVEQVLQNGKVSQDDEKGTCRFRYRKRNTATPDPCKFMKFAQYGSFTDTDRQSSSYESTHPAWYQAVYAQVSTWIVQPENIVQLYGFIGGMTINIKLSDGTVVPHTFSAGDRGLYVDKNIYFGQVTMQLSPNTIEDLKNEVANYDIEMDTPSAVITLDSNGNVLGGLGNQRLKAAITVRKSGETLALAAQGEDAGHGTYRLYTSSTDCTCHIQGSTVFIDAINNTIGSAGDTISDMDAMRNLHSAKVNITIDCEGRVTTVRTFTITIDHQENALTVQILGKDTLLNGQGTLTLTARAYDGGEDITDTLTTTAFSWERESEDAEGDALWNLAHKDMNNVVVISKNDVTKRALFSCVVNFNLKR